MRILLGDEPPEIDLSDGASTCATEACHEVMSIQSRHWKCFGKGKVYSYDEVRSAGHSTDLGMILKAHRTHDAYHQYRLNNIQLQDPELDDAYKNQLLVSPGVYDSDDTLLLFFHDFGSLAASYSAVTLDLSLERTLLLDASATVLQWARSEHGWEVLDMNFLHALQTVPNLGAPAPADVRRDERLAVWLSDTIVQLSRARHIVCFGFGSGAKALVHMLKQRRKLTERVVAVVNVLGEETPPIVEKGATFQQQATSLQPWYLQHSRVFLPSTHRLHKPDPAKPLQKRNLRKFGNVAPPLADGGMPIRLLQAAMPEIRQFVSDKLALAKGDMSATTADATAEMSMQLG